VLVGSDIERVLGRIVGGAPGPTLICVGGVHGNEPAGVLALERILASLRGSAVELRGEFVALTGNRQALGAGRRFLATDLNRAWKVDRIRKLRSNGGCGACPEDEELVDLLDAIEDAASQARGEVFVLDLHTTSAAGGLFTTVADTLPNRRFAMAIPVPLILGLEELVNGTMLEYLGRCGFTTAVMEGGQHEDPRSVDLLEAGLWLAIAAAGLASESDLPHAFESRRSLRREVRGLPKALEMRHRYHIDPGDDFKMRPGYKSFDSIRHGEVLAFDHNGEVRAPSNSRILMPLYQEQGNDGFFLVRPFSAMWLHLSEILRSMRMDRFLHWLPGVHRDSQTPGALVADLRVARWYALQLFHLLGYRKHLEERLRLVVIKREDELFEGGG
jgi:Succinylglutamate desuccinylase / Aspartoacylase family